MIVQDRSIVSSPSTYFVDRLVTNRRLGLVTAREALELVERLQLGAALPEHVALDPPGEPGTQVVGSVTASGYTKNIIELLEGALLGLGEAEEDDKEGDDVQTSVEAESCKGLLAKRDCGEGDTSELQSDCLNVPPVGVKALSMTGKVRPRMLPTVLFQATQKATPISRCERGKHSAAYTKGTGPIPGE